MRKHNLLNRKERADCNTVASLPNATFRPQYWTDILLCTLMKLSEIPLNTLVELHFNYLGFNHKVKAGLFYKNDKTVYVSAIKNAGKTIPASKLKDVALVY